MKKHEPLYAPCICAIAVCNGQINILYINIGKFNS